MTATQKRSKRLIIRWTDAEHNELLRLAARAEITPTDYVRTRTLDKKLAPTEGRAPSVDRRLLASGIGRLADIGDTLKEIESQARAGETPYDHVLHPAIKRVIEASEAMLRALGVQP